MPNPIRRPVFYLRKSLIRNSDDDLQVHQRRLEKAMHAAGDENPIILREPEGRRSAYYSERRPGYQQLLDLLSAKQISTIYVNDRARLWRNDIEWISFLYQCQRYGTRVVAVTESKIGDVTDSNERMLEFFQGNRAQAFRDDLSARHRLLKADLKAAGIFAGARVFGLNLVGSKFERHFEPNADFPIIVEILRLYVNGLGTPAIAAALQKRGLTWRDGSRRTRPQPRIILNLIHHLERYQPFLPPDLYDNAIAIRSLRSKHRSNSRNQKHPPLLLRMLLVCAECNQRFYSKSDYTRAGIRIGAYFHPVSPCPNPVKWHRADLIHAQLYTHFAWLDDDSQIELMVESLCAVPPNALDYSQARQRLQTKLNNLEDAYLAGDFGEIETARPYYRKKRAALESELHEIPEQPAIIALEPYIVRPLLRALRDALRLRDEIDPQSANLTMRRLFAQVPVRGHDLLPPVWLSAQT